MANMSYCRFQNTLNDLRDCFENAGDFDDKTLSKDERHAFIQLVKLCDRFAASYYADVREATE